jgi:hypothetical protein
VEEQLVSGAELAGGGAMWSLLVLKSKEITNQNEEIVIAGETPMLIGWFLLTGGFSTCLDHFHHLVKSFNSRGFVDFNFCFINVQVN